LTAHVGLSKGDVADAVLEELTLDPQQVVLVAGREDNGVRPRLKS